jgi:hypothetical protein
MENVETGTPPNIAVWGHCGVVQRVEGGRRKTGSDVVAYDGE